jgi:hypothetical protein
LVGQLYALIEDSPVVEVCTSLSLVLPLISGRGGVVAWWSRCSGSSALWKAYCWMRTITAMVCALLVPFMFTATVKLCSLSPLAVAGSKPPAKWKAMLLTVLALLMVQSGVRVRL